MFNSCKNLFRNNRIIVFIVVFAFLFAFLFKQPSMIGGGSSDSSDIWKMITSWGTNEVYYSYVSYKGILAIYPYVWLYHLAKLVGVDEFIFIKILRCFIICFTSVIAIPDIVLYISNNKKKEIGFVQNLQILAFSGVLCFFWNASGALTTLLVDVPSSFIIFLAIWLLIKYDKEDNNKYSVIFLVVAFVCLGLLDSLSGQYRLSTLSLIIMGFYIIYKKGANRLQGVVGSLISYGVVSFITKNWYRVNIAPHGVLSSYNWMYRGLLYFMDKIRIFSSLDLSNPVGYHILIDYYGSIDKVNEVLEAAGMGHAGWSVKEYLCIVLKYPFDFLVIYFERFFAQLTYDLSNNMLLLLIAQYCMLFLFISYLLSIMKKDNKMLIRQILIVAAVMLSIVPSLVLVVEMRYGLSAQAIIWGIAIFGGIRKRQDYVSVLGTLVAMAVFVAFCLAFRSALSAQCLNDSVMLLSRIILECGI